MKTVEDIWKDFAYRMCKELNIQIVLKKYHKHPNDKSIEVVELVTCNSIFGKKGWVIYKKILNSWKDVVCDICNYRWSFDNSENPFFSLHVPAYHLSEKKLIDLDLKGFSDILKAFNRL